LLEVPIFIHAYPHVCAIKVAGQVTLKRRIDQTSVKHKSPLQNYNKSELSN